MGAIQGFRPDANGDGILSQQEIKLMKEKLGLDTSFLLDDNGNVAKGVKVKGNSIFIGDEERVYNQSSVGNGNTSITSTSIITCKNGDKLVLPADDIEVSANQLFGFYKSTEE